MGVMKRAPLTSIESTLVMKEINNPTKCGPNLTGHCDCIRKGKVTQNRHCGVFFLSGEESKIANNTIQYNKFQQGLFLTLAGLVQHW